ncbi:hypothetical protein Rcae01_00843 [Novipirellula caenicola]|uniref:Uncharacterized protein n=1 Tax=Novipirellula caenicola TaxID=1536901 RepID=A0ABP9VMK2_9BACT
MAACSKGDNHHPQVPKGTACCSPRREPWVTTQPKFESPEGAIGKTDVDRDRTRYLALAQTQHRQKKTGPRIDANQREYLLPLNVLSLSQNTAT